MNINTEKEAIATPTKAMFDPRSPTAGIQRTPVKEVFELNEKLDEINFKMFKEEFGKQEEEEGEIHVLDVLDAEEYYARFAELKAKKYRKKLTPLTMKKKHHANVEIHSPSKLYCFSPASSKKFAHYFPTKAPTPLEKLTIGIAGDKENEQELESPGALNVTLTEDGQTMGTFFSPCHTKRKVRRVVVADSPQKASSKHLR